MANTRPSSASFWNAYPNYDQIPPESNSLVWDKIGGGIGATYGPQDENTCAARVSYGLNYGGAPIVAFASASVNSSSQSYKGKAGDDLRYIVSAMQIAAYLRANWGAPDKTLRSAADLTAAVGSLAANQCAIFATPAPPGGHGHSGVLRPGYTDPYVSQELPVEIWILPL